MGIKRIDEYAKEEEIDMTIDKAHLTSFNLSLPKLHSKWLRYFFDEQAKFLKLEDQRRKVFRKKHEYYLTKYDLQIKPNQVIWYIESDEEYSKILLKSDVQKKIVEYLEIVVKKISNLNYTIKNILDWEKYKIGI